jgi:adenosylcobinamide kinase / adenosylcobinamide-phosphate guanylyltransferase
MRRAPLLLVIGGARSGKSDYTEERLGRQLPGGSVLFVATLPGGGPGRDRRIARHQARRDPRWQTVEVGDRGDVAAAVEGERGVCVYLDGFDVALRSAWPGDDERAEGYAIEVADALRAAAGMVAVIVTSEAGMGTEPESAVESEFRDRLGAANRALAAQAEEVVLVVAGLPMWLKGEPG